MARKGDKKIDLLGQVPLFSECSQRELKKIAALTDEVKVDEGTVLTNEGKPGREFFVIAEGKATATLRRKKLAELGPGSFFGEMALLDHQPRAATITAETPMRLYVVDPLSFASLIDDSPGVARKIMKEIARRLREQEQSLKH